jgi:hypothetical protein
VFGLGKNKAVVGLDIGSSAVKAVELKPAGKGFRVAAFAIEPIAQRVKEVAGGQPFSKMSMAEIDAANAVQMRQHGGRTVAEVVTLIGAAGPVAAGIVRSLSDAQLDIKVHLMDGMPEVSLETMIQLALVGHPTSHLAAISGAR